MAAAGVALPIAAAAAGERPRAISAVAIGDSNGGITDRAYIMAPPHVLYVVEKEAGSFLDCGEGMETRIIDKDGRDFAELDCGVTLTETVVIPAASSSARVIIHY